MTGEEIKKLISEKNEQFRQTLQPNVFTLNKELRQIAHEIVELQNQCPHDFQDGLCIYCYMSEEKYNGN